MLHRRSGIQPDSVGSFASECFGVEHGLEARTWWRWTKVMVRGDPVTGRSSLDVARPRRIDAALRLHLGCLAFCSFTKTLPLRFLCLCDIDSVWHLRRHPVRWPNQHRFLTVSLAPQSPAPIGPHLPDTVSFLQYCMLIFTHCPYSFVSVTAPSAPSPPGAPSNTTVFLSSFRVLKLIFSSAFSSGTYTHP